MSEYIASVVNLNLKDGSTVGKTTMLNEPLEEIVRCRDCKWYGYDEERYAGLGCIRVGFGSPIGKMPDGFCAWGVEK